MKSRFSASSARGPRNTTSPMCETSKRPTRVRTASCSSRMPGVLDRHLPAGELHHARASSDVRFEEGRSLGHGAPRGPGRAGGFYRGRIVGSSAPAGGGISRGRALAYRSRDGSARRETRGSLRRPGTGPRRPIVLSANSSVRGKRTARTAPRRRRRSSRGAAPPSSSKRVAPSVPRDLEHSVAPADRREDDLRPCDRRRLEPLRRAPPRPFPDTSTSSPAGERKCWRS